MPRKKNSKQYFTKDTEDAIIEYNNIVDKLVKDRIYKERIAPAFDKLAEIVYNKWKFTYCDDDPQDVMAEVVAFMIEKIHMYKAGKGKAFSYFTIVARNYLILNNNANYKRYKDTDVMSAMPENWDTENNFKEELRNEEHRTFNKRMILYWDIHLETFFTKKRDLQIADAILELFRRAEYIENFNKKSLYLLVREMTGYPTHYITKVVNKMKEKQMELYNEYDKYGDINDNQVNKKKNISELIESLRKLIRNVGEATVIAPIIKDLIEVSVKNDDHLVKLATIAQRLAAAEAKGIGEDGWLSEAEKNQLLADMEDTINAVEEKNKEKLTDIEIEIEDLKKKI